MYISNTAKRDKMCILYALSELLLYTCLFTVVAGGIWLVVFSLQCLAVCALTVSEVSNLIRDHLWNTVIGC